MVWVPTSPRSWGQRAVRSLQSEGGCGCGSGAVRPCWPRWGEAPTALCRGHGGLPGWGEDVSTVALATWGSWAVPAKFIG